MRNIATGTEIYGRRSRFHFRKYYFYKIKIPRLFCLRLKVKKKIPLYRKISHLIYNKMSLPHFQRFIRYSRFVGDESRDFANIIFF